MWGHKVNLFVTTLMRYLIARRLLSSVGVSNTGKWFVWGLDIWDIHSYKLAPSTYEHVQIAPFEELRYQFTATKENQLTLKVFDKPHNFHCVLGPKEAHTAVYFPSWLALLSALFFGGVNQENWGWNWSWCMQTWAPKTDTTPAW